MPLIVFATVLSLWACTTWETALPVAISLIREGTRSGLGASGDFDGDFAGIVMSPRQAVRGIRDVWPSLADTFDKERGTAAPAMDVIFAGQAELAEARAALAALRQEISKEISDAQSSIDVAKIRAMIAAVPKNRKGMSLDDLKALLQ